MSKDYDIQRRREVSEQLDRIASLKLMWYGSNTLVFPKAYLIWIRRFILDHMLRKDCELDMCYTSTGQICCSFKMKDGTKFWLDFLNGGSTHTHECQWCWYDSSGNQKGETHGGDFSNEMEVQRMLNDFVEANVSKESKDRE